MPGVGQALAARGSGLALSVVVCFGSIDIMPRGWKSDPVLGFGFLFIVSFILSRSMGVEKGFFAIVKWVAGAGGFIKRFVF